MNQDVADLAGQRERLMRSLDEDGVRSVRVGFADYNGIVRARSVSLPRLPEILERGVNFSSPTVDFNTRDLIPPSAAFDLATPDFWARPDPNTYRHVPSAEGVGSLFADLVDAHGQPWEGCPRTTLKCIVQQAAERGLRFGVGFEPEGYLFRQVDGRIELAGVPAFATADGLERHDGFMQDLLADLAAVGLEVEQWSEEYGPGQVEVNLRYTSPVEAADGLVTFKQTFRAAAQRHGLLGTFMPKPFADHAGTGLHVHLSATAVDDPSSNLFNQADQDVGLSALGRCALGGILLHGESLTALGATTVNSYKRFLPGSWAPTHIVYAYASRAPFVRIPERETARRLELRVADPAGNPYLFLAGILAAMLDGIEREIDPGSPVPGNVGGLADEEARARGARPVPSTLAEALDHLERDDTMREALGRLILEEFVKIKRSEWEAFRSYVGEWDREWYLERY